MPNSKCNVCHRLHEPDQPCPLRIAGAYTMLPQAQMLTEPDKAWIRAHPDFNVLDTVEDTIADMMFTDR